MPNFAKTIKPFLLNTEGRAWRRASLDKTL